MKNLPKKVKNVKRIIAIGSGKGGVGKSTTATNLALALDAKNFKVGILDADIYGPSQPKILGIGPKTKLELKDKRFQPIVKHGLESMSIGYLVDPDAAMIWRGPMASGALCQLLYDTDWGKLDYLIIDLPPGTGDLQLTMAQKIPVDAAIVVTTPQDLALIDVEKSVTMFNKVNIPVLGVIENMSMYTCTKCGHNEYIFGENGGTAIADKYNLPLLGRLPLDIDIRKQADIGHPSVIADPKGAASNAYLDIADNIIRLLVKQPKSKVRSIADVIIKSVQ